MEALKNKRISVPEYLSIEHEAQVRYEYYDGFLHAMAGGTYHHGLICSNITGELRNKLIEKSSACTALNSEVKLHVVAENSFLYPDAMVICDEPQQSHLNQHAVTNPVLIVEVLSKSTAINDRGDKFYLYRQIPSLREYVLIEQDKAQVEIYKREGELWKITRVNGLDSKLMLASIDVEINFERIYYRVKFE